MQDISTFPDSGRGLPCQPDKGQISFIRFIRCSDLDENVCVCVGIIHTLTHSVVHTRTHTHTHTK